MSFVIELPSGGGGGGGDGTPEQHVYAMSRAGLLSGGTYLRLPGGAEATFSTGWYIHKPITITEIGWMKDNTTDVTFELKVNNANEYTWATLADASGFETLSVNAVRGDWVSIRSAVGNPTTLGVKFAIVWQDT